VLIWYDPTDPDDILIYGRWGHAADRAFLAAGTLLVHRRGHSRSRALTAAAPKAAAPRAAAPEIDRGRYPDERPPEDASWS
jgi:hypothetical protein